MVSEEEANDISCSVTLQGLDEEPFAADMQYLDDSQEMRAVMHKCYATESIFSKASIHTTLARMKYGCEGMEKYLYE